jgi:RNA polymerase sigma-70 factor (ECF subfamily)
MGARDDESIVSVSSPASDTDLLALYDRALPDVYGYLLARCRNRADAEDVTGEVFMAAVDAVRRAAVPDLTVAWLIGVARHKLVDHWRRREREDRRMEAVASDAGTVDAAGNDPWPEHLDVLAARDTLATLSAQHRAALTLRYLDGLSVPEVSGALGRSVHATEALLVRARQAFRVAHREGSHD